MSVKPSTDILERANELREANERILNNLAEEQANAALRVEIEGIERKLVSTKGQLSVVEAENLATQASNKQRMNSYKAQLEDAIHKNLEGRRLEAVARVEYEKAVAENKLLLDKRSLEQQIRLEQRRADWVTSRNNLTASRQLVETRKAEFVTQILDDTELKGLINSKLALSIRARYASVINSIASTSLVKAVTSSYRRANARLATSLVGRKLSTFNNLPRVRAFKKVCLGPITEVAGIALTAWQNGAFTGDEEI